MSFAPTRVLARLFGLTLVFGLLQAAPSTAVGPLESTQDVRPVAAKPWAKNPRATGERAKSVRLQSAKWPAKSSADVALRTGSWAGATKGVWLRSSERRTTKATVRSLGRIDVAGRPGVGYAVTTLKASSGLRFKLDYSAFQFAFGGNWADRLQLQVIADCSPKQSDCVPKTLVTKNDTERRQLSAALPKSSASQTVRVAATAAASGKAGDFSASPLAPSSSWSAGGQGGDFTWSYPMDVPPAVNGPAPSLSIDYSSGSVDGRMISTNNQTSWVGEGFSLDPGSVERSYIPCRDVDADTTGSDETSDLCWRGDNLTMSFGGHSGQIIRDGSSAFWRFRNDDGTRIQLVKTAGINADNNGEFWVATTVDGTKYYFGRNKRFDTDDAAADSVSTVPVMGCDSATYSSIACDQGWRWSLDYVVDPHGNSMSYNYTQEDNKYGTSDRTYNRGGYLTSIEYGTRKGEESARAPARVLFATSDRCLAGEASCKTPQENPDGWPDVPADQMCSSSCDSRTAPTFFTTKRLTSVTTQVLDPSAGTYSEVSQWTLTQTFPASGDNTSPSLWLDSIKRKGDVPATKFTGEQMPNRVDATGDGENPFIKWRVTGIDNGIGRLTTVTYSRPECTPTNKPSSTELDSNTKRCYPAYWQPDGYAQPRLEFFHKYVVTEVSDGDIDGFNSSVVTSYDYQGGGAWHYTDNDILKPKYRTWDQWRGFGEVATTVGNGATKTYSSTLFLRGMNGDRRQGGGTKNVSVSDGTLSDSITDSAYLVGFDRRTVTKLGGPSGDIVDISVNDPWKSASATATDSDGDTARLVNVGTNTTRTRLGDGTYRKASSTTDYDDNVGLPRTVFDDGNTATTSDDRCTSTKYAQNTDAWLMTYPSSVITNVGSCAATISSADDVISATKTVYDAATPVTGDVKTISTANGYSAADGITYQVDSTMAYDAYGRLKNVTDALGRQTATAYSPATGIATTLTTTNALGQTSTVTQNRSWGKPTSIVDVGGAKTEVQYDDLGRTTAVWEPGRDKAGGASASTTYAYNLRSGQPNAITTKTLNAMGNYKSSVSLVDGLGREISTQTPAPGSNGGWLITETKYDSRGLLSQQAGPWYTTTNPNSNLVRAQEADYPTYTDYQYDGASRKVTERLGSRGSVKWVTTTKYAGDRVTTIPPAGGTTKTVVSDVRGKMTSLIEHTSATSTTGDTTSYTYTPAGSLKSYTNANSTTWQREYDIRGQLTKEIDPDRGTTTYKYDKVGNRYLSTDAKSQTLWTAYDELNRKVELRDTNGAGTKRASWTYDKLGTLEQPGALLASTRYVDGNEYTTENTKFDTAGRLTSSRVLIPASEGALSKPDGYVTSTTYAPNGMLKRVTLPRAGDLPSEGNSPVYDQFDQIDSFGGWDPLLTNTVYSPYGQVLRRELGVTGAKAVYEQREYDEATRRLTRKSVTLSGGTVPVDLRYGYDPAGNVTKLNDVAKADTNQTGASTWRQCFSYDYLARLKRAWTSSGNSCAAPTTTNLGTLNPYDEAFSYDKSGNRTQLKRITTAGGVVTTATSTSTYPAASTAAPSGTTGGPHALKSVSTVTSTSQSSSSSTTTENFTYDLTGNTDARSAKGLKYTWDAEGNKASVTKTNGDKVSYIYDADGNRLIERTEPTGGGPATVKLWVGTDELTLNGTTVTGERTYSVNGEVIAVRTGASTINFQVTDGQGTPVVSVDSSTAAVVKRRFGPFGRPLTPATTPAWPTGRNFLNKTSDTFTGTVHLGAREYDPLTGRFLSVDPVAETGDPQQLNGYAYAENSPVTYSDPDGLFIPCEGARCAQKGGGGVYQPKNPQWNRQANANLRSAFTDAFARMGTTRPKGPGAWWGNQANKDFNAGIYLGVGQTVDVVGQAIFQQNRFFLSQLGIDQEFTYGTDAADWLNEIMGADPNSVNGIMGQVTFAAAPIGPVGLAGKAATGTRLLRGATTLSRTTKAAKSADDWPILSGIVRDAGRGKGNFGVGSGTASQATRAGKSWVGEGYRIASDGTTLVSRDGLRSYRPPSWKPDLGKYQANYSYWIGERVGKPVGNGHLDVTDMGP